MVEERESKEITRRQFLKGLGALGASALLSSCGVKEKPSPEQPTKTPSPTEKVPPVQTPGKTKEPTVVASPEPSLTPETRRIAGTTITADYLKSAFAGIGGEEIIQGEGEYQRLDAVSFGERYASSSWGQEIDFTKLSEDPIFSLKYLISLGAYRGEEGVFTPGRKGEEVIFPQLKDLSLPRLTLEKVPSEGEQKEQEFPQWISPQGLLLRPDTQMTVVGLLNQPQPAQETTVDKEVSQSEFNYALVAFTDYLRADDNNIPRHYLALLPTHLPADQENQNTLTLKDLLEANGCSYDPQTNELTLTENNLPTILSLNRLEGEELTKDLRQETGLAFVDRMNDKLIKNPVVPYPDQMPAVWNLVKQEEEGKIGFLLQEQNEQGELVSFARAFYDEEKEAWRWKKVEPALEPGEILIGQDFIALPKEKILELLNLPENKDRMILPVFVGEDTVVSIHARPEGGNSVVISNLKERVLIKPSVGGIEQWINKGPRGMHLNYRLKNNGLILTIFRNEEVETTPITPDNEDKIELGTVLASGFKDIDVWPSAYDRGDNPYDISVLISPRPDSISNDCSAYILKYKERWVVLREK